MAITKPNIFYAWAATGGKTDPGVAKTQTGWVSEIPTYQNFNWLLNRQDVFNQHVNERGIAEWDAITPYIVGSLVTGSDGHVYRSLDDPNTGNDPVGDFGTNWIFEADNDQWIDTGHTPAYYSAAAIQIVGVDATAEFHLGMVVSVGRISVPGAPLIGRIVLISFVAGNTRLSINFDINANVPNETLLFLKRSSIDNRMLGYGGASSPGFNCNLPFGLNGLHAEGDLNSVVRYTPLGSLGANARALTMTRPDTVTDTHPLSGSGSKTLDSDTDFFSISVPGSATSVTFTNISTTHNIDLRYRVNKGAWTLINLAPAAFSSNNIGANGVIEFEAMLHNSGDVRSVIARVESDGASIAYSSSTVAKRHIG